MNEATARLADALQALGRDPLVVVTGAGISLASGIPTFRGTDPDAVWHRDVTEMGTERFFRSDPAASADGSSWPSCSARTATSCCSTSRPTTWT